MTRNIIDINDFTILVEEAKVNEPTIDSCFFDEPIIAVAFYGSGNVDLEVKYTDKQKQFNHTKGLALSFYADEKVDLAQQLWDSVASNEKNLELSAHQKTELERRLAQFEKDPEEELSWGAVKSKILNI